MSVLLELRHEPSLVRIPLGELQEKLHEGMPVRRRTGGQCSTSGKRLFKITIILVENETPIMYSPVSNQGHAKRYGSFIQNEGQRFKLE